MRPAAALALLLLGCSGDPEPVALTDTPEAATPDAPTPAAPALATDIAWAGVYTDARRTLTITDTDDGLRVAYEDNSVPGWSAPFTGSATRVDDRLECPLGDLYKTKLRLALTGGTLTVTTVRAGHENPRRHPLTRVLDPQARAAAEAAYVAAFPNKTVGFPEKRAQVLVNAAEAAAAEKRHDVAARLLGAAAQLFEPLAERMIAAVHRQASLVQPSVNPNGTWSRAAALYGRASDLAEAGRLPERHWQALMMQAFCVDPANAGKGGSYGEAAELYLQAEAAFGDGARAAQCRKTHGFLLHRWATSEQPNTNDQSTLGWAGVVQLYAEAAELRAQAGDAAGEAQSLNNLAVCLAPSRNPNGTWERSAAMHAEVAALHKKAGNQAGWQGSVRWQAKCLWSRAKDLVGSGGSNADALALFERAHQLAVAAKARQLAKSINTWVETLRGQ